MYPNFKAILKYMYINQKKLLNMKRIAQFANKKFTFCNYDVIKLWCHAN